MKTPFLTSKSYVLLFVRLIDSGNRLSFTVPVTYCTSLDILDTHNTYFKNPFGYIVTFDTYFSQ